MSECNWDQDCPEAWHTDCAHWHQFEDGSPYENGYNYCPYCGNKLIEKPLSPEQLAEFE